MHCNSVYCAAALLILSVGTGILPAQEQNQGPGEDFTVPTPPALRGLQIYSMSAYAIYYSSGFPEGVTFQPGQGTFASDMGAGGSTRIGWTRSGEKSDFSVFYTPSYTGRVRYAEWNALNHALSIQARRKLAAKWTFEFAASGNISNLAETFFTPTVFSNVASVPASFPDLASAMLAGKYSNSQLASILTGAPLIESPGRNLFYGERMFMSAAQATLSYSHSPRLSVNFLAHGDRSQYMSNNLATGTSGPAYLIPNATSAGANLTVSYSLSPRTQIGATASSTRIVSVLQDSYITSSNATLGRTMGSHWFLQVHGGVAVLQPVRQSLYLPSGPQPTGGGSLGFRTFSHTFLGAYDHIASDSYGYGAVSTASVSGAWKWRRPGRLWWVECGLSQQQLQGNQSRAGNLTTWRVTGGWGRMLGAQSALLAQYVYMSYSGQLQNASYTSTQSAVRLSVLWSPHPNMVR